MDYRDCQKIVDATEHIFKGTNYSIDYGLDGDIYFELDGEFIDLDELPEQMQTQYNEITDKLNIAY